MRLTLKESGRSPVGCNKLTFRFKREFHLRSARTMLLALGAILVFECHLFAGETQFAGSANVLSGLSLKTAPFEGGLLFLLLAGLFVTRRNRAAARQSEPEPITLSEQNGRVEPPDNSYELLAERFNALQARYESLSDQQRMFFDNNPTPILVHDRNTLAFLAVNEAAIREYGYSHEEFLSRNLRDIQLDGPEENAHDNSSNSTVRIARLRTKDSRITEAEFRTAAIVFEGKDANLIVAHDVTAWRRESEMRARELHLHQTLIETLPGLIYAKDREGRFVAANMAVAVTKGAKKPEDLIGKSDFDYHPKELAAQYHATEEEVMRTGRGIVDHEVADTDEEGHVTWSLNTTIPWVDSSGHRVGILGMKTDITERRMVEDQLGLMKFSIEHAGESVFWLSPDLRFVYVNHAACDLLGYTREELLAMRLDDVDKRFPVEKWPAIFEKMKSGEAPTFQSRHTAKDGRVIPVEVSSNYLEFNGREYSCTFVRDTTKRKQAEEALKKSLAELELIVSAVSESDLTKRAVEDETTLGRIAQSVNKMLTNFSDMILQVKGLGLTVSSGASQILVASEDIAVGLKRQAEEISDSSSAMEEMAASMSQVSRNAENTSEAAQRALEMAQRGDVAVHNTLEAMERIDVAVQLTAEKMQTLAQRSSEISDLLVMVNGIASQTNLLSVNAAIQAAHAGEAGLGFSVVAEEIRKLAERSSESTKDINRLNKAIQEETGQALSSMDLAMKEVKGGSQLAKIAGQSIQDISAVVTQSASLIEEITTAAAEQSRASRNIASAMQTVSSIATQTSAGTHETSTIMHNLASIAENLTDAILKFKIVDDTSRPTPGPFKPRR